MFLRKLIHEPINIMLERLYTYNLLHEVPPKGLATPDYHPL